MSNTKPDSSQVKFIPAGTSAVVTTVQDKLRESVSVKDFGAIGDGVTDDTAGIQAAVDYAASIGALAFAPSGTYKTGQITFPTGLSGFLGAGVGATIFVISGAFTAYTPVFKFDHMAGFDVGHFAIDASVVTYATNHAMQFDTCSNGTVSNIYYISGGFIGCHTPSSHDMTIRDLTFDAFVVSALLVDTCYRMTLDNIRSPVFGAGHTVDIRNGYYNRIVNSHVAGPNVAYFGILLYAESLSAVVNCTVVAISREGIQITNGNRCSILNCHVTCAPGHADFGVSVFSESANISHNKVSGCTVRDSGKAGIAISASTAPAQTCTLNMVSDNLIINPNVTGGVDGAGVLLLGGSGCNQNTVSNNMCVDQGNKMTHGALEAAAGPNYNALMNNSCVGGAVFVQENGVTGAQSEAHDLTWTSYATVVSATSGTITTASGTFKYKRRGKQADVSATATITNNGTGSGGVRMTLPFTIGNGVLAGHGMNISGKMVQGYTGGAGAMILVNYDNTYPGATGELIRLSGTLEI